MEKIILGVFVLISAGAASLALTAAAFLSKLAVMPAGLDLTRLGQGRVLDLLFLPAFWAVYPAVPDVWLEPWALALIGVLTAVVLYFWAVRTGKPTLLAGFFLLICALVPYVVGRLALRGNAAPEMAGPWLAFMIYGVLYAVLACVVYCGAQLVKWERAG